jgi:hypothetical protein
MNIHELGTGPSHLYEFVALAVPLTIFTAYVLYKGSRSKLRAQQEQRANHTEFDSLGGIDLQQTWMVDKWMLWVKRAVKRAREKMSPSKQPSIESGQDSSLESEGDVEMTVRVEHVD